MHSVRPYSLHRGPWKNPCKLQRTAEISSHLLRNSTCIQLKCVPCIASVQTTLYTMSHNASIRNPAAGSSSSSAGNLRRNELRAFVTKAQSELLEAANTHISQLAVLHETAVERIRNTAMERINELRSQAGMGRFTGEAGTSSKSASTSAGGGGPKDGGANRARKLSTSNKIPGNSSGSPLQRSVARRADLGVVSSSEAPARLPEPKPCASLPALYTLPKGAFPPRSAILEAQSSLLAQGGLTAALLDEGALAVMGDDLDITMPPASMAPRQPSTAEAVQAAMDARLLLPWSQASISYHARRKQHFVRTPLHPNNLPPQWLPPQRGAAPAVQTVTSFLRLHYFSARSGKAHEGWWLQFPIGTREYSVRVHLGRDRGDAAAAAAAAAAAPAPTKGKPRRFVVSGAGRGRSRGVGGGDTYKPTWLGWMLIADGMERSSLPQPHDRAVHFAVTPGELQWIPVNGVQGGSKSKPLALPYWPTGNPPTAGEREGLTGTANSIGTPPAAGELPVGAQVLCNWLNTGCMWVGKVAAANADGSYHVAWTDGSGEHEWSVPRHRLELEGGSSDSEGSIKGGAGETQPSHEPPKRRLGGSKRPRAAVAMSAASTSGDNGSLGAVQPANSAGDSSSNSSSTGAPLPAGRGVGGGASHTAMGLHSAGRGDGGGTWPLEGERLGLALWTGEPVQESGEGTWMESMLD